MLAASFWSLLTPAIERADEQGVYGEFTFVPVTVGFLLGALFCYGTDVLISQMGTDSQAMLALSGIKDGDTGHVNPQGPQDGEYGSIDKTETQAEVSL